MPSRQEFAKTMTEARTPRLDQVRSGRRDHRSPRQDGQLILCARRRSLASSLCPIAFCHTAVCWAQLNGSVVFERSIAPQRRRADPYLSRSRKYSKQSMGQPELSDPNPRGFPRAPRSGEPSSSQSGITRFQSHANKTRLGRLKVAPASVYPWIPMACQAMRGFPLNLVNGGLRS